MILLDDILTKGSLVVEVREAATGRCKERQEITNMVVLAGRNLIRNLLANDGVAGLTHFAAGTGSVPVDDADVMLQMQVYRDAITSRARNNSQLVIQHYMGSRFANGHVLREVGLFNAASGGVMYARALLVTPINKTIGETVTFTWNLNFTQ